MKRTFALLALTTALLLTAGVGSSFARSSNGGDDDIIHTSFHKDFLQAELLETKTAADYTRLTFKMSGIVLTAYYSSQGELLAIVHNIKSTQLPLPLLLKIRRDYDNYWISDLFEMNKYGESTYYITLENADKKITLRSFDNDWSVFSKSSK